MTKSPPPDPFEWQRSGRSAGTIAALILIWGGLAGAYVRFDASPWVIGILGAFGLPSFWDIITARQSRMRVDSTGLAWQSGRHTDFIAWDDIALVRLDTRLDLSVRTVLVLRSGRDFRLPIDTTPPVSDFESALSEHGAQVRRHHFTLVG